MQYAYSDKEQEMAVQMGGKLETGKWLLRFGNGCFLRQKHLEIQNGYGNSRGLQMGNGYTMQAQGLQSTGQRIVPYIWWIVVGFYRWFFSNKLHSKFKVLLPSPILW